MINCLSLPHQVEDFPKNVLPLDIRTKGFFKLLSLLSWRIIFWIFLIGKWIRAQAYSVT